MNLIQINQTENYYLLSIPNTLTERAKKINSCQWDSLNQLWKYPRNISNYNSLMNEFNKDIDDIKITPPELAIINQKNTLAEKNRVIAAQRKQIETLESEIIEREHEIDRYISTIISLNEKIDHLLSNDGDIENVIKKVAIKCVGKNERYLKIIEEIEFDLTLPIELPKKVVNILKTITKTQCPKKDFVDLIFEGKKVKYKNLQSDHSITTYSNGIVTGELFGGNLSILCSLIGSKYLPEWKGKILFIEDVMEEPYRIDRMLFQLKLSGLLDEVNGVILGSFRKCTPKEPEKSFTLEQVFEQHFSTFNKPVFYGAQIGHVRDKFTLPIGVIASMNASSGTITLVEPSVV